MTAIELTVPCVAAHLLVTPVKLPEHYRHLAHGKPFRHGCHTCVPDGPRPMVLRFLPTDATAECETCRPWPGRSPNFWLEPCPSDCTDGHHSLRAGDRIAIRADDNVPGHCEELGRWMVTHKGDGTIVMYDTRAGRNYYGAITLRPGEVVGYATVTDVLSIVENIDSVPLSEDAIEVSGKNVVTVRYWAADARDHGLLSDHTDAGLVFTPGQVALELAADG